MLKLDILFQQTAATPHLFAAIAESIEIQINVTERKQECWNARNIGGKYVEKVEACVRHLLAAVDKTPRFRYVGMRTRFS